MPTTEILLVTGDRFEVAGDPATVEATIVGRKGDGAVIELRSDKVVGRYPGRGHEDGENVGGVDIDLKLAADDPVLANFAATGKLDIYFTSRWVRLPNAFAQAHDFLRLCRQRP